MKSKAIYGVLFGVFLQNSAIAEAAPAFPEKSNSTVAAKPVVVQQYSEAVPCASAPCMDGTCAYCEAKKGSWMTRKTHSFRRWWQRHDRRKKGLNHPVYAPLCEPNWGYHPTCWRKFPPIVCPCPPASDPAIVVPPTPVNSTVLQTVGEKPAVTKRMLPLFPLDEEAAHRQVNGK